MGRHEEVLEVAKQIALKEMELEALRQRFFGMMAAPSRAATVAGRRGPGRPSTKGSALVAFLSARPEEVFSPAQAARETGIDVKTTRTTLARLVTRPDGGVEKVADGKYRFRARAAA